MCTLYLIYPMLSDWICSLKFKFHHHIIHITTQIHIFTSEDRDGNIGNKVDAWDTLIHPSVHSLDEPWQVLTGTSGRDLGMISMMMSSNGNIFPRYWHFVRGIHRSPVNSPHKGQWRGALMFCLIWAWINRWVNNCEAGELRCHLAHYEVIVMGALEAYFRQHWTGYTRTRVHELVTKHSDLNLYFINWIPFICVVAVNKRFTLMEKVNRATFWWHMRHCFYHTRPCAYQWFQGCACKVCETTG